MKLSEPLTLEDVVCKLATKQSELINMIWSIQDRDNCYSRGFGVFTTDDGIELLKLDDPFAAHVDVGAPGKYTGPIFKTDEAAAKFVQDRANKGCPICRKAIDFLIQKKSPSVKLFQLS